MDTPIRGILWVVIKPISDCRLYTFVDTAFMLGRAPALLATQLCEGGSDIIQLRAKGERPEIIRQMAEEILPVTRKFGVALVINDHLDVAREIGAEVCHLGQEDFFDAGHRHVRDLGNVPGKPGIGLSTHSPEQAQRAVAAGPDYIAIGPVFATGTKPTARPVTLDYVRWAAENVVIPWFAIGGINLQNLDEVLAAGARRICVVSAILNRQDVSKACMEFKSRLT